MAVQKQLAVKKKTRRIPTAQRTPLRPAMASSVMRTLEKTGAPHELTAAVDPGILFRRLAAGRAPEEYPGGKTIFSQGDPADTVYYIQSGKVKLAVVSERGKEAVIAILSKGSFFGENCLAGRPVRMATASTVGPSVIVRVGKPEMMALLHRNTEFAESFVAYLLSRNIRMEADLVDHLFNSSEKRLARLLLLLANFGKESKPIPVIANMSQETLAEMVGTTRSRVSYFLNRFRDLGFIDYNGGGMQVHSSLISVVLHD